MNREPDYERIRDAVGMEDYGTIRVCEQFGTIAIYIKVADNQWHTVYVDPVRGEFLVPKYPISDAVAGLHPVVYSPKSVG